MKHLYFLKSWLGLLNFFVLQWFFVRLMEVGHTKDDVWVHEKWRILWAPVPLTGWWWRYVWLYKGPAARSLKKER